MGFELLKELPNLIESPEIILNTISQDKANKGDIPTTLASVLNKEVIKNIDGKEESCPVIAFIEPNMSSEEATVVLSAYPKEQYERFLEDNIKKGGLLYLKNKEALRRDRPVNHVTSIATVSFTGLLYTNNIARFNENVNLKQNRYKEKMTW